MSEFASSMLGQYFVDIITQLKKGINLNSIDFFIQMYCRVQKCIKKQLTNITVPTLFFYTHLNRDII